MQYTANTTRRLPDRNAIQQKLDRAAEWSRKPMTSRAECAVAAITGTVTFALLFAVYMIA